MMKVVNAHVVDVYIEDYRAYVDDDDPYCVVWSDGSEEHRLKYDELSEEARRIVDREE